MVHSFLGYRSIESNDIGFIKTFIIDHTIYENKLEPNNIITAVFPNKMIFGVFYDVNQFKTDLGYIVRNHNQYYDVVSANIFGYTTQQPFKYFNTYGEVLIELWNLIQFFEF